MWDSRPAQYINLQKVSGQNNLYMTIFKFDPSSRLQDIQYGITITNGPGKLCVTCPDGTYNSDCECRCRSGMSGKICSRRIY